uniref:Uncharacterized protein n=1 Tax=Anguilla anguilla TaxID=7936 RepID=A0A0E9XUK3_ANGAN
MTNTSQLEKPVTTQTRVTNSLSCFMGVIKTTSGTFDALLLKDFLMVGLLLCWTEHSTF